MQNCAIIAEKSVVLFAFASWMALWLLFWWMYKKSQSKKSIAPLLLVLIGHPILWGWGEGLCSTPLLQGTLIFTGLGVFVGIWSKMRNNLHVEAMPEEKESD